jgi:hypothetical protein
MSKSLFMIILLVLFVTGLFMIFSSVTWGSETANTYLLSQGGGMDSTQFMTVLQGYINAYTWIGSILSLIGGLGIVKVIELR